MSRNRGLVLLDRSLIAAEVDAEAARNAVSRYKQAIGEHARAARHGAGVSLREMARLCDVSPAMLSDFERGRRWSNDLWRHILAELT